MERIFSILATLLLAFTTLTAQTADSLSRKEALLRKEALTLADKALNDKVVTKPQYDSLLTMITALSGPEVDIRIDGLRAIIDKIDSDYDASMRLANSYVSEVLTFGDSPLPAVLDIPDEYVSPEERRRVIELVATMNVKHAVAVNMTDYAKLWRWQKWMVNNHLGYVQNKIYSGEWKVQKGGGLVAVPKGAPAPSRVGMMKNYVGPPQNER